MAGGLYEYSVSPNLSGKNRVINLLFKIFKVIDIIISIISFILAFFFDNVFWILFAIFIIALILIHIFSKSYFSAYDCIFVDGSIRIDRVYNNRRKRLISFDCKNIRFLSGVSLKSYQNNLKNKEFKKINLTNKELYDNDFYLIVSKNGVDYLITMRFNNIFLSHVLKNVNTRIIEKEYKELLVK